MRAGKAEIAWVLGGRMVAAVGALASIKIITGFLTVADVGVFGLALAIANGTSRFAFNPLAQPLLRFSGSALQEGDFAPLIASYYRAFLYAFLVTGLVAIGVMLWGVDILGTTALILTFMLACCIGLHTGNAATLSSMRFRKATALSHVWVAWGRGLMAIPFMVAFGARPEVALCGYVVAVIPCLMWQSRTIMHGTKTTVASAYAAKADAKEWASYITYAAPFFIIFGIDAAAMEIDKAIVAVYFSQVELGAYVAMQLLARMPVFFVVGFIEQLVYPIFFQNSRKTDQAALTVASFRSINRIYLSILALLLLFVGGVYIFRDWIVWLLTTAEYVPYALLLPLLMLAGVVSQSSRILQAPALKAIGSRVFIPAKIVQVVVLVGGMIAAIPYFGLYGVAIAANAAAFALVASIVITNLYYLRRDAGKTD